MTRATTYDLLFVLLDRATSDLKTAMNTISLHDALPIFELDWTAPTAKTGDEVRFTLAAVAVNDGEAMATALGSAVSVDDSVTVAGAEQISAASAAMTAGGTPTAGCKVRFKLVRDFDYGTQPLSDVVQLNGIRLAYGKA